MESELKARESQGCKLPEKMNLDIVHLGQHLLCCLNLELLGIDRIAMDTSTATHRPYQENASNIAWFKSA
ncbi:MAG: hypothetical protein MUO26_03770 [Methanotrichaceae archaeon]|nr:hypothetical protein [Methanotrichaceae archaeon]